MAISGRTGYRSSANPELSSQSIDLGSLQLVDENSLSAARKSKFLARKKFNFVYQSKPREFLFPIYLCERRSVHTSKFDTA
jgi:hypothetical protein